MHVALAVFRGDTFIDSQGRVADSEAGRSYTKWTPWMQMFVTMLDFGGFPHSGGYLDQDFLHIEILNLIRNAYYKARPKWQGTR